MRRNFPESDTACRRFLNEKTAPRKGRRRASGAPLAGYGLSVRAQCDAR